MNFALNEDHLALRQSAATFLDKEISLAPLLKPGAGVVDAGYSTNWEKITHMGWQGIVIPEADGGLGLSEIDLAMVLGEMGRTLAPSPFLGNLLGTWALEHFGSEEQKSRWLPSVAAGDAKLALAIANTKGQCESAVSEISAEPRGGGHAISGSASFVIDAGHADRLVVAAKTGGGSRGYFLVDATDDGVAIETRPWRDITREVSEVHFRGAFGELLADERPADWDWLHDRILFALSAENASGIQHVLSTTTEYAKDRVAFGKPIGAYQAIKHSLAEMLGQSECANVAVLYAAWALSENAPQASLAAAMAKAYTSDAYVAGAHRSIQIFGAIGFTWEMPNHLYLKRAHANAELFGNSRHHRNRVIQLSGQAAA